MAYDQTIWKNDETPLTAENMNHLEQGISSVDSSKVDKVTGKSLFPDSIFAERIADLGEITPNNKNYVDGGTVYEAIVASGEGSLEESKAYTDAQIEIVSNKEKSDYETLEANISTVNTRFDSLVPSDHRTELGVDKLNEVAFSGDYNDLKNQVVIDQSVNATSTNAVSNKAVNAYYQKKIEGDTTIPYKQITNRLQASIRGEALVLSNM